LDGATHVVEIGAHQLANYFLKAQRKPADRRFKTPFERPISESRVGTRRPIRMVSASEIGDHPGHWQ